MGSMANKSTMFSKQSLIRLYKLEMKGFVQYGQAFFLCFAPILPPIYKFQSVLIIDVAKFCLFGQLINHWSDCVLSLLCNV